MRLRINIMFLSLECNLLNCYCNLSVAEDYDKCIIEAQRLNKTRRKEMKDDSLFDSNQPRKAAMKFKATLGQRVKSKKSADITNTVENNKKKVCIIFPNFVVHLMLQMLCSVLESTVHTIY